MKRSQMIRIIQDALWCHLPHIKPVDYYENSKYIAEAVLQSIEGGNETGEAMVPPPRYTLDMSDPYCPAAIAFYSWEPEDEK